MSKEITLKDVMDSMKTSLKDVMDSIADFKKEVDSRMTKIESEITELKVEFKAELKASEVRQREYTDKAVEKLVLEFVPESKTTDSRRLNIPWEERALQRR